MDHIYEFQCKKCGNKKIMNRLEFALVLSELKKNKLEEEIICEKCKEKMHSTDKKGWQQ